MRNMPQQKPNAINTSFLSTSSLTTLPASSQSSSRRVVKDGIPIVTNSSSDLDSLDGDSDSDDDDLDMLLARKRQKLTPRTSETRTSVELERPHAENDLRRSTRRVEFKPEPKRRKLPPRMVYKNSLASLIKQKRKDAALDAQISGLEAAMGISPDVPSEDEGGVELGQSAVAAIDEDEEEGQRLKQAMKRMDALHQQVRFHFFNNVDIKDQRRPSFPESSIGNTVWTSLLKDRSRDQTFISGFAADLSRGLPLTEQAQEWVLGELLYEDRDDLCQAYVDVLEACSSRMTNCIIDRPMVRDCMSRLGGRDGIVYDGTETRAAEAKRQNHTASALPNGLRHVLLLLCKLSPKLSQQCRIDTLSLLILMLADDNVQDDAIITRGIGNALSALITIPNAADPDSADMVRIDIHAKRAVLISLQISMIMQRIRPSLTHPALFNRVSTAIPSSSVALHRLKRHLALSYFLHLGTARIDILDSDSTWTTVTHRLSRDAAFLINEGTDFARLAALISILDCAVGAGFSPNDPSSLGPASFDKGVDGLVSALRKLSSNIRDAGAAHMRRTECKGAIDRLAVRLEFSVRTKPKPKKGVFGSGGTSGDLQAMGGFLEKFMKMKKEGSALKAEVSDDVRLIDEDAASA